MAKELNQFHSCGLCGGRHSVGEQCPQLEPHSSELPKTVEAHEIVDRLRSNLRSGKVGYDESMKIAGGWIQDLPENQHDAVAGTLYAEELSQLYTYMKGIGAENAKKLEKTVKIENMIQHLDSFSSLSIQTVNHIIKGWPKQDRGGLHKILDSLIKKMEIDSAEEWEGEHMLRLLEAEGNNFGHLLYYNLDRLPASIHDQVTKLFEKRVGSKDRKKRAKQVIKQTRGSNSNV